MLPRRFYIPFYALVILALCTLHVAAQVRQKSPPASPSNRLNVTTSPALQGIVDRAAQETLLRFAAKKLDAKQLAITVIDLGDVARPVQASYRGGERIYTASVVKLFYLAAAERWLEDGRLKDTEELQRALRDMIVDSSNDATGYVLDVLTDTSSGMELPPAEMAQWLEKRNAVNRYFVSLGYADINLNQKTFCEDAYGRERYARGANGENRNMLTTDATARLLAEIAARRIITPARDERMLKLLQRDYAGESKGGADDQAHGFTGIALKDYAGARLWSKAGWTSAVRHDAAYIELPNGARFVVVTFTVGHSDERDIIPTVARYVLEGMSKK